MNPLARQRVGATHAAHRVVDLARCYEAANNRRTNRRILAQVFGSLHHVDAQFLAVAHIVGKGFRLVVPEAVVPTANVGEIPTDLILPHKGAYAVMVKVDDEWRQGMVNVGVRPTLDNGTQLSNPT